jgi:5-(carboxyamino)imidazole ribonucleotide mutase
MKLDGDLQKAVIIMGSKSDLEFCEKIRSALNSLSISSDVRVASAHRTPEYLLKLLREYYSGDDQIVAITVAGLSDALSGVVAAQRMFPVIACPPDLDKYDLTKVFSSAYTPSDVPVAFVSDPAKAAYFTAQIFALTNPELKEKIATAAREKRAQLEKIDSEVSSQRKGIP